MQFLKLAFKIMGFYMQFCAFPFVNHFLQNMNISFLKKTLSLHNFLSEKVDTTKTKKMKL